MYPFAFTRVLRHELASLPHGLPTTSLIRLYLHYAVSEISFREITDRLLKLITVHCVKLTSDVATVHDARREADLCLSRPSKLQIMTFIVLHIS